MQANQLLTADLLDILFDGKNKAYGAYNLRKTYNERLLKSMLVMLSLLALIIFSYIFSGGKKSDDHAVIFVTPDIDIKQLAPDPEPVVPPPAPKPAVQIKTTSFAVIRIVPDLLAPDNQKPPQQEDLTDVRIGLTNTDGIDDNNITPVVSSVHGVGTGVVDAPQKAGGTGDEPFISVQIESQYPGGLNAWSRFLYRNLGNNYPEEAYAKRIQGKVIIQFIVDRDGTVSNVEAISGPEELREAAINVIRKSGKWEPAIQNGSRVKSYKKQPITFLLEPDE